MKRTLLTSAFAAILGLALAGAPLTVQAQTTPAAPVTTAAPATTPAPATSSAKPAKVKKADAKEYKGSLTAVDPATETVTIQVSKKKTLTLAVASTTKIKKDKKPATLADFTVGDKVTGSYTTDATGKLTAKSLSTKTATISASRRDNRSELSQAAKSVRCNQLENQTLILN